MNVTAKDVEYVAELAHLDLTTQERARIERDLDSILAYIDMLNELDTANVTPMAQVQPLAGNNKIENSSLRPDESRPSLDRQQDVMINAPETDGAFFKVPKVIER